MPPVHQSNQLLEVFLPNMAADTTDLALKGAGNRHARSLDLGAVAALPVTVRAGPYSCGAC